MISENLENIKASLPDHVTLVAVSKTKPIELLQEAYDAGQRIFGENRVHELVEKFPALPQDIEWHMIGHLQSKKVKSIAPFVSVIHSIDSFKLLKEVNKQAKNNDRVIDCLLQFHIAQEETKYGFSLEEVLEILGSVEYTQLENISIVGVMGMATFTSDQRQVADEFHSLKKIFEELKNGPFTGNEGFKEISMGMSGDYQLAIQQGSTMVRVGSSIFGARH